MLLLAVGSTSKCEQRGDGTEFATGLAGADAFFAKARLFLADNYFRSHVVAVETLAPGIAESCGARVREGSRQERRYRGVGESRLDWP